MALFKDDFDPQKEKKEHLQEITLSTGNVSQKYIVRDIIFATDRLKVDLFSDQTDPNQLFSGVVLQLKQKANEYGADAVINCHFDYRNVLEDNVHHFEIFAYGTVVQFLQTMTGG